MINFLNFKDASCKDCYKCLRECPVKAIKLVNHQAKIIEDRCILCGNCIRVCPQNAKKVHSQIDSVKAMVQTNKVIASVAPSFVSSFGINNFNKMKIALGKLGFYDAEETAVGAKAVTLEYKKFLEQKTYKNLISSACPAINKLIQQYYPEALKYLAPCDTPMVAHAKILNEKYPDAKVVFIGPCIAKQREAYESSCVDGVLTFEDLSAMFDEKDIVLEDIVNIPLTSNSIDNNKARYYPISRGIIKSFDKYVEGYEFVAVTGIERCMEVLENIDKLEGIFLELNSCEFACVNGPCSNIEKSKSIQANTKIRAYTLSKLDNQKPDTFAVAEGLSFDCEYQKIRKGGVIPSEQEIAKILAKTGKTRPEDELNCGACGYPTCREKAWAVANGYAVIDMCVPYMREKAESMSFEIIKHSPNGIIVCDYDLNITEINNKAISILGIDNAFVKGQSASDFFDVSLFVQAVAKECDYYRRKIYIEKTKSFAELSVTVLKKQKVVFGVIIDTTEQQTAQNNLNDVKLKTLKTTEEVIKKQMVVAQEIASLLGETTAETKVALLKLKKTLENGGND